MSLALIPGQNAVLRQRVLRFTASSEIPLDLSALVIGEQRLASSDDYVFYNQPTAAGLRLTADGVMVDLDDLGAEATSVLCIVSADPPTTPMKQLAAQLADPSAAVVAEFTVALVGLETAVICFELYRRGADWKVRAVGQGYAGGLAQLLSVHGVDVDDPPAPSPPPRAAEARSIAIEPLDPLRSLERMWMIFEDAARSTAAVNSAKDFALKRLDEELSAAVADPSTRHSPAAADARDAAQNRCDELVSTAEANYQNDAVHLITELDIVNPELPRSLASWESPAWQSQSDSPLVGNGIRLGEMFVADRGLLRVPFCITAPLRRPLWVDTTNAAAAMPVVTAIVLRLLAATPSPVLDVVDLTGSLRALTDPLTSVLSGPVVESHNDVSTKLSELANLVELAEFAAQGGLSAPDAPARVLVLSDFGHGLQGDDLTRLAVLVGRSAAARLSVVIVGEDASSSSEPLLAAISQHCQHIPTGAGDSGFVDPWTRNRWEFTPDAVPQEANRISQFIHCVIR